MRMIPNELVGSNEYYQATIPSTYWLIPQAKHPIKIIVFLPNLDSKAPLMIVMIIPCAGTSVVSIWDVLGLETVVKIMFE